MSDAGDRWPPEHRQCVEMCRGATSGTATHRTTEVVAHRTWPGRCRVCLDLILKKDGTVSARQWHPRCWQRYALCSGNMRYIRELVWRRDHGVCAMCDTQHRHLEIGTWEADHIVPLIAGGGFELDNLQTLCAEPCHRSKTAAEAKARAGERRGEKRRNSPQLSISL